ncbi:MAG: hypothetical protein RL648_503 [Verrucomicrobiota bacterium]
MKSMRQSVTGLMALMGSGLLLSGQPVFHFSIDETEGVRNLTGVGAAGEVDFGTIDAVGLTLTNTSIDWTASFITGVYVLKPTTLGGFRPDATLSSGPTAWNDVGDDGNFHQVWSGMGTGLGNNDEYLYFGSEIVNNPDLNGLGQGSTAVFSFDMDSLPVGESIDWAGYLASEIPHVFIRWQGIQPGDESAKGYAYFSPVPEPSVVASMAILGVIGMVLWRRRGVRATEV